MADEDGGLGRHIGEVVQHGRALVGVHLDGDDDEEEEDNDSDDDDEEDQPSLQGRVPLLHI